MSDRKEIPSTELSLKYMAWNVKEISENIKILTNYIGQYIEMAKRNSERRENTLKQASDQEIPF